MERFAAMVAGRRAAPASEDAAYLSIQLEEIVIVKNDAHASTSSLGAAHSGGASSAFMGPRGEATAPAADGSALSKTMGWIVGSH